MAKVIVKIPASMRSLTAGEARVEADGGTIRDVIADLDARHPGLQERLCEDDGKLRRFINLYANQDDIRFLDGLDTAMSDGDELSVIPAIAGGK